ncbi:MAG: hypothetical protein P8J17_15990 [Halioglobus sp.]|nr:hypothetical protein [Halioglobus sp.]
MRTLSALILLIFVTACSHPLEITGDGDINSSTGENDCLLEEHPCSNYVLGSYDVTYTAQPRAGWFFSGWEGCGDQHPHCSFNIPGSTVNLFWGETTPALRAVFTQSPPPGNRLVTLNVDNVEAKPFGELFRSVNLDAGKQLNDAADIDRITQLMCRDPLTCTPGAIRYWDKVQHGRFALEQEITHRSEIAELHSRGFSMFWSLMGTPAFLRDSCSGCVVANGNDPDADPYHILREVNVAAADNPTGQDIACSCSDDDWWAGPPDMSPVGGVSWLDYLDITISHLLMEFDGTNPKLRIGLWNEPDQIWWKSNQTSFVNMWCASAQQARDTLGPGSPVLVGGPDISSWERGINPLDSPALKLIQDTCGGTPSTPSSFDFLVYHNYSKSARFLLENSAAEVRSWGTNDKLIIDVGEYAAALSGADATTACDLSAIAGLDGEVPVPTGVNPKAVLCDHRGAAEEVALAATMAAQDHDRLYRFEVWDWGTIDMVNTRMGLLTINNLPKPTATSFWMLSQLQGERIAVINELDGAFPFHLLASREDDEMVIVVASQDQTVSEQFIRGLLADGLVFNEDVAPQLTDCTAFESEDTEAQIAALAQAGTTAQQLLDDCPNLDSSLADSLASALAYAAPRAGHVGETFQLTIEAAGWQGPATRHRIDAYRNTFAETYRQWPDADFASPGFDFAAEEESLWSYMTEPLDQLDVTDGRLTIEVRPNSVTLLRGMLE